MKLVIAGQDCSADLGATLTTAARARPIGTKPAQIPETLSALRLHDVTNESDYLAELLRLLRYRDNVDTLPFDIPRKPGLAGSLAARFKARLWKLLRYQHDRVTFRQNLINNLYSSTLEFQQREIHKLRQQVAALEQKAGKS